MYTNQGERLSLCLIRWSSILCLKEDDKNGQFYTTLLSQNQVYSLKLHWAEFLDFCIVLHMYTHVGVSRPSLLIESTDSDIVSLYLGPRFVLNLIKVFEGSFGGATLYENPNYITPNAVSKILF